MGIENRFLIDVLKILPEDVECFIQAPDLENKVIQNMMSDSIFDYYKIIKLNNQNKEKFINQVMFFPFIEYIQSIQIKYKDSIFFEGFDGIEIGILSNNIIIPKWFNEKYIDTKMCIISNEW